MLVKELRQAHLCSSLQLQHSCRAGRASVLWRCRISLPHLCRYLPFAPCRRCVQPTRTLLLASRDGPSLPHCCCLQQVPRRCHLLLLLPRLHRRRLPHGARSGWRRSRLGTMRGTCACWFAAKKEIARASCVADSRTAAPSTCRRISYNARRSRLFAGSTRPRRRRIRRQPDSLSSVNEDHVGTFC